MKQSRMLQKAIYREKWNNNLQVKICTPRRLMLCLNTRKLTYKAVLMKPKDEFNTLQHNRCLGKKSEKCCSLLLGESYSQIRRHVYNERRKKEWEKTSQKRLGHVTHLWLWNNKILVRSKGTKESKGPMR